MLTLKEYQRETLRALETYCQLAAQYNDADTAYYQFTRDEWGIGIPYNPIKELCDMPYICLRIPTGGGKTLLACHIIPIVKRELLHSDYPLVLWLVPSNAIREQTLAALKDRQHPYRQALETELGSVNVMDVSEALYSQRTTMDSHTSIIVSTLQAFRVEDTDGRKVYETNGNLLGHFAGYSQEALDRLEKREDGSIIQSLANVLKLRRPLVIVDEAHNARTDLSFTTLARFAPSAIIELTATPDTARNPSNVLYSVSAAELHSADMIKMPIILEALPDWRKLLSNAIAQRDELEKQAKAEQAETGEYIRPIMLLQAQPSYKDRESINVDVLEKALIEEFKIPADQIARATGSDRGLDGVDVLSKGCPIRYVITVQALREGWDCPFAYVLCSVAEMSSSTFVEQMLGRIMRLPHARRKGQKDLNQAYAFVASAHFAAAANALVDGLVQNGFKPLEARDLVINRQLHPTQTGLGPLFEDTQATVNSVAIYSAEKPDISKLPPALTAKLSTKPESTAIVFTGWMSDAERHMLKECYSSEQGKQAVERAYWEAQKRDPRSPSQKRIPFSLPVLAYKQGDWLEELDKTHYLERQWRLLQRDTRLTEDEFPTELERGQRALITISTRKRLEVEFLENVHRQMTLLARDKGWTIAELVYWLDRAIPHPDITASESGAFINQVIHNLMNERGLTLDQLVHDKYRLMAAIRVKIDKHRADALNEAFQEFLLPDSPLIVTPELLFTYDLERYPYNRPYQGDYKFTKHYYPQVGDLKASGEEFECARYIDTIDEMQFWVRNPERSAKAFSLQTYTDRFYPDFVCQLQDGRYLVVEYKGQVYRTNDDSKEKNSLGELWEKRSNGTCLFLMVSDQNYEAIRAKISSSS